MEQVIESERALRRPDIDWVVHLAPVPPINGHEAQLREMLGHLLTNAYEAMPAPGGTVTVSTGLDTRGWIALEVRDNGPGVDSKTVERAVEPFFTTKAGHLGVGLSIANGIWRRHRGTLALRSQPGEGTVVRLYLDPQGQVQADPVRGRP